MVKGLKEYVEKHGTHFTQELAYSAAQCNEWSLKDIEKALRNKVYYDVSGCTPGDLIFIVNGYDNLSSKKEIAVLLIKCVFCYVGEASNIFKRWVSCNKDFDFTPYI